MGWQILGCAVVIFGTIFLLVLAFTASPTDLLSSGQEPDHTTIIEGSIAPQEDESSQP